MITKEQFTNGLLMYADREIMPALSTGAKWGMGTILNIAKNKAVLIIDQLAVNPLFKSLDIVSADGLIDIDLLLCSLKESAERYGKLQFNIPMIGVLTFSCEDVDKLKNYMGGGYM